uniref:Mediator of RNA polymerase II transcription subunit 19 n=1 Tax=Glossina pallidipes TaxID=7398 RepID=A0A1A9ZCX9_GLOPL
MKIILCPRMSAVTYMDEEKNFRTYRFSTIIQYGCSKDLYQKIRYAQEKLNKIGRSPVVSRQDSLGTLKATISLGKTPTIIQTGPFYSMKEPPSKGELTGDKDLMTEYGLHHTSTKFKDKKVKESLASFLSNLPGIYDSMSNLENSTLRNVIDKPPIGGKELLPLTAVQLAGFRLHPGPLPEQYRT